MEKMNAVLLAGGESSRFGEDKALAEYKNELIISRIVSILKSVFAKVYVVVDSPGKYSFLEDVEFCVDLVAGCGPLGGIYTALKNTDQEYNFVMACDMPCIAEDFLKLMRDYDRNYDILVPRWQDGIQPLASVYTKRCLAEIEDKLAQDIFKIIEIYPKLKVKYLDYGLIKAEISKTDHLFYNINYQADLVKLEELTKEMGE